MGFLGKDIEAKEWTKDESGKAQKQGEAAEGARKPGLQDQGGRASCLIEGSLGDKMNTCYRCVTAMMKHLETNSG